MEQAVTLSILIPVYNFDVRSLLQELQKQIDELDEKYSVEILVVDDASEVTYNVEGILDSLPSVIYEENSVNRGRAKVRNRLVEKASGEILLFLDGDVFPDRDDFLLQFLTKSEQGYDIICGGRSYKKRSLTGTEYVFYLYKSIKTEVFDARTRNKSPWRYLFTSNVMVRKNILDTVYFDDRFVEYGYEDIEWAIRLHEAHEILHIDNTCSHLGLLTKAQTFEKMRASISNYALLLALHRDITKNTNAAVVSSFLSYLPGFILSLMDKLLTRLFFILPGTPLLFIIFQCDKLVLLGKRRKHSSIAIVPYSTASKNDD